MKHRLLAYILAAGVAAAALPARAQSLSGYLDVVDQQSVLGWACYSGDANSKLPIALYAVDAATSVWTYIGTATADKQRNDVGGAGICGSGTESYYHGFEWPIYPDSVLAKNKSYWIYAYASSLGQYVNGSGRMVSFPESGLPTSGIWRTDLDDPNNRAPALLSCIWPYLGANARGYQVSDPLWINPYAGATWPGSVPYALGFSTPSNWCINHTPASAAPAWSRSNAGTNATGAWPMSNFWVLHINYEPAYSMLNSGPPGQSQPLGGLYTLSSNGSSFTSGIDNTQKPAGFDGIPFISFGAQMGRGTAGPLAAFDPNGSEVHLRFNVTKTLESGTNGYHAISVFIEAMWGGAKRWAWITLQQQASAHVHWNWNAYPSFFYPGADLSMISLDELASPRCGINIGTKLDGVPTWSTRSYDVPIGAVFKCIASGSNGWTTPRPAGTPLFVTAVHFSVEQADGRPDNKIQVLWSLPQLVK